jgi:prepilin-type processing-associated H-X9-DG protein
VAKRKREPGELEKATEREEVSRRRFLRKTAEVAALSLFGTLALDDVIRKVVERMAEIRGIDRLARNVAEDLRLSNAAYADGHGCPPP